MSEEVGYVVIEFNQASHQPSTDGDFFQDRDDAEDVIEVYRQRAFLVGRKERYAIGVVTIEEEE